MRQPRFRLVVKVLKNHQLWQVLPRKRRRRKSNLDRALITNGKGQPRFRLVVKVLKNHQLWQVLPRRRRRRKSNLDRALVTNGKGQPRFRLVAKVAQKSSVVAGLVSEKTEKKVPSR